VSGYASGPDADVVAVHRDVQRPDRRSRRLDLANPGTEAVGELHSPGLDPEQHKITGALVAFENLMCDPGQRPGNVGLVEDLAPSQMLGSLSSHCWTSFPASQDGSLKDV
jgi:hypothetical protein